MDQTNADIAADNDEYWTYLSAHFPTSNKFSNLENAYCGMLAHPVFNALQRYQTEINSETSYFLRTKLKDKLLDVKHMLAEFCGVDSSELLITRNLTEAIYIVLRRLFKRTHHSSINRWSIRFLPILEKVFRQHKRPVGISWRMDETYIKVKGVWKYLYRAVDKEGKTIDFLLTAKRDKATAMRFFDKAIQANDIPEKITMDKSGANKAATDQINESMEVPMIIRQVKYLNNIVEQVHRAVKLITKPMLGFKSFNAAKSVLSGSELMHMIRKGQSHFAGSEELSFADKFYTLAGEIRSV